MSASIKITFAMDSGKDYALSISDCPEPMTVNDVKAGVKDIVDSNAMMTTYGKPVYAKKAVISVPETRSYNVK